jgi:hypothetical protein
MLISRACILKVSAAAEPFFCQRTLGTARWRRAPNDLFEFDTTPVARPARPPRPVADQPKAAPARGRSMPPMRYPAEPAKMPRDANSRQCGASPSADPLCRTPPWNMTMPATGYVPSSGSKISMGSSLPSAAS